MLDYIVNNKEWIFSGIGISGVVLLFWIFMHFYRRKDLPYRENMPNNTSQTQPVNATQVGDIPQEDVCRIVEELEETPPLHSDDARKNYVGLNVDWLTEYYSANKKNDDLIRVSLTVVTESFRPISVHCEVNLSDYKQFSILKREAKIRVVGKIVKFESYFFELSDVRLYFQ
ncbi:MAG: hypothetical protein V3W26_04150 [Thermodesulfobacteriota bacterium]